MLWEIAGIAHVDHLRQSPERLELRGIGVSSEAASAPTCTLGGYRGTLAGDA